MATTQNVHVALWREKEVVRIIGGSHQLAEHCNKRDRKTRTSFVCWSLLGPLIQRKVPAEVILARNVARSEVDNRTANLHSAPRANRPNKEPMQVVGCLEFPTPTLVKVRSVCSRSSVGSVSFVGDGGSVKAVIAQDMAERQRNDL